jgi:hypothetical protein
LTAITGVHCGYSFWVGMEPETQCSILRVTAQCPTMDSLAVFRDPKNWRDFTDGSLPLSKIGSVPPSRIFVDERVGFWNKTVAAYLNQVPGSTGDWRLSERYPTKMYSSGRQHEVWIFCRNGNLCAAGGGGGPSSSGATGAGVAVAAAAGESSSPAAAVNTGLCP